MANLDLQIACDNSNVPHRDQFIRWFQNALPAEKKHAEISVRIVAPEEMQSLNAQYRGKNSVTNVLSFPCALPQGIPIALLGDIVICADVIEKEAGLTETPLEAHWAHMLVHGTLHLLGYDHETSQEAQEMEALETRVLMHMGYASPYHLMQEE